MNARKVTPGSSRQSPTPLQVINRAITEILEKDKAVLEKPMKHWLEDIVEYIKRAEDKERKKGENTSVVAEVSTQQLVTKQDISDIHYSLSKQLDGIVHTVNAALYNVEQSTIELNMLKEVTYKVSKRIGKVNKATIKIADTTQLYCDALS